MIVQWYTGETLARNNAINLGGLTSNNLQERSSLRSNSMAEIINVPKAIPFRYSSHAINQTWSGFMPVIPDSIDLK